MKIRAGSLCWFLQAVAFEQEKDQLTVVMPRKTLLMYVGSSKRDRNGVWHTHKFLDPDGKIIVLYNFKSGEKDGRITSLPLEKVVLTT